MSNQKLEQKTNGEEENSQVDDEMLAEFLENEITGEEIGALNLQAAIKHLRNEKGDVWTANFIKDQFPSINRLWDL